MSSRLFSDPTPARAGDRFSDPTIGISSYTAPPMGLEVKKKKILWENLHVDTRVLILSFLVLPHWKALSSHEGRNFVICKKQKVVVSPEFGHGRAEVGSGKVNNRGSIWKSLFHSLKVSSH